MLNTYRARWKVKDTSILWGIKHIEFQVKAHNRLEARKKALRDYENFYSHDKLEVLDDSQLELLKGERL